MTYQASATGAQIDLAAPVGPLQAGPRTFVFSIRGGRPVSDVALDGRPLATIQIGQTDTGWWKSEDAVTIQFADDSKAHKWTLR